jgi:hypothetical protein
MEKKRINEHDVTKKMLNVLREDIGETQDTDGDGVVQVTGEAKTEQEDKFKDIVTKAVKFTSFNVYPEAGNVTFGGIINNELEFNFSMEESDACYITCNNFRLSSDKADMIKKLQAFYTGWYDDMHTLLEEYSNDGM